MIKFGKKPDITHVFFILRLIHLDQYKTRWSIFRSDCFIFKQVFILISPIKFLIPFLFLFSNHLGAYADPLTPHVYSIQKPPLLLRRGEQKVLHLGGIKHFSVGSAHARAVTVPDSPNDLLVKGISAGNSDLIVWHDDHSSERRQIRVSDEDSDPRELPLLEALSQLNEIEVIQTGGRIVLRGEVQTNRESAQLALLLNNFAHQVIDSTTVSPELVSSSQQKLDAWLKTSKFSSQLWSERIGQDLWVRGHVDTQAEQQGVEKLVGEIAPFSKMDIRSLPDQGSTIYFKVFLLELKKMSFRSLGVNWPGNLAEGLKITATGIQGLTELTATVHALDQSGDAKILSNPELVVLAPGDAELFSGGEVPISVSNQWDSHVEWKPYGLSLRLHVTHVVGAKVRLDITAGVSHIEKKSGEIYPDYFKNEMKQHIEARFGEPLFLSGLLKEDLKRSEKGLPLLRKIPLIGSLFGSVDYLSERSELVAILYPYSAPPKAPFEKNIQTLLPKELQSLTREWVSPQEERLLRSSKNFPWNILDATQEEGIYLPKGRAF